MTSRKITQEEQDKIVSLYRTKEYSYRNLADMFGCTVSNVRTALKKAGDTTAKEKRQETQRRIERRHEDIRTMYEKGFSRQEIAQKLGASVTSVKEFIRSDMTRYEDDEMITQEYIEKIRKSLYVGRPIGLKSLDDILYKKSLLSGDGGNCVIEALYPHIVKTDYGSYQYAEIACKFFLEDLKRKRELQGVS